MPFDPKTSFILFPIAGDIMSGRIEVPCKKKYDYISPEFFSIKEIDPKRIEDALLVKPQIIFAGAFDP